MHFDWQEILQKVIEYVLPLVIAFVVAKVLPKVSPTTQAGIDWVKKQAANVKNDWARSLLQRVVTLVGQHVLAFEQVVIEDLKDKVRAGRISPADIPGILKDEKEKLLAKLKEELTTQNLWGDLKTLVGGQDGDENLIFKFLGTVLESQVAQLPPSGLQSNKVEQGIITPAAVSVAPPPVPQQAAG